MQPSADVDSSVRVAMHAIWDHAVKESGVRCGVCAGKGEVVVCGMSFECTSCGGGEGMRVAQGRGER